MGQATVEHLAGIRRVKRRLGEESPGEEELTSRLQAAAFSFAAAGLGKNQRFPPARVELSVTEFLPVVPELEVDQWPVRRAIQFQGAAFPGAAVGSEPHSSVLSEGQVELAWLCHWSGLCGHGAAA